MVSSGMIVLIWVTLLFSVRSSKANTGASVQKRTHCPLSEYCITLNEGEITGEAGLCVVIPCSFTTSSDFIPKNIVWLKCEPGQNCEDSDVIFRTNNNRRIQPEFRGRVSLLEPDVSQNNCSIIINDVKESDSGSYQLRVLGSIYGQSDRLTYPLRATVSIKGLSQRPTVMIPSLTAGQQATLTCTAPGLCSGSDPKITWRWRGAGEKDSNITGNITANQGQTSTLTFNSSAEHHGTNITCEVSYGGSTTTEETVTLSVTYVKEVRTTGNTSVKEGETLNLTCSVESFPPSRITWTKFSNVKNQNGSEPTLQNNTKTHVQEESGKATISISNVTAEDSGRYICTVEHLNSTLTENIDVTVTYMREAVITGNTTVKQGDDLSLTCSLESFPPSLITWTKDSFNTSLYDVTDPQNHTGSSTLIIPNVAAEHSGQYTCTAKYLEKTVTLNANVTVTWLSKILSGSGCAVQSGVLTCVCISEGFPLPTIEWPLLKNHTEYSVTNAVSNYKVSSTIILNIKNHNTISVECVISQNNVAANKTLTITNLSEKMTLLKNLRFETILAFMIGVLLSAIICILVTNCHRGKRKSTGTGTLEMVTSQEDPLMHDGQAKEDGQAIGQDGAEYGTVAAEKTGPELDGGPKDVEYASIDFSLLKRRSPREASKQQETPETEYAEIKKEVKEERKDDDEGEKLEYKEEEEEIIEEEEILEEDEETKRVPEGEEGEDMAVYSNVKDIMNEI